jgi:hypothetical protein
VLDQIRKLREAQRSADETLFAQQNRARTKAQQLAGAKRRGAAGADEAAVLERELAALEDAIARNQDALRGLKADLSGLVGEFVIPQSPQELASQLDDSLPCLLFPMRMETRFMSGPEGAGRELWVRIYPDDIAVHTHEKALTRDEADAGLEYWTIRATAALIDDETERERIEKGAWRALAHAFGGTRAAWIAAEIRRRALEKEENQDLSFLLVRARATGILNDRQTTSAAKRTAFLRLLDSAHPFVGVIRDGVLGLLQQEGEILDETRQAIVRVIDDGALTYLDFDLEALKPESWSRAPRTQVLPDRFVLIGITGGFRQEWPFPAVVPSPLILGPNPQNLEKELAQSGGDLIVGEDYAWIWDFEEAIKVGMAMRVPLPEPFARAGFDRLMVLGMRVSAEPAAHRELLEELIDNHRYSPDGMGLLPQGTPTNHTADARSGFSTEDAEGDASFELEKTDAAPDPAVEDLDKSDAQRLAEAWDVGLEKLAGVPNADLRDVSKAKIMNRALWPATIGYFLDELLETEAAGNDRVRRFFTVGVVARGSLPAIRVGKQPYGVLVTSAFSRWQADDRIDGDETAFLRQLHDVLGTVETHWQQLVGQVSHVDAPGDSFAHLLNILGLHATSVDFNRRIGTYRTVLWNLAHLMIGGNFGGSDPVARYFREVSLQGIRLLSELGFQFPKLPKIFGLMFSDTTSHLNGPFVDDVALAEDEKLSEEVGLPAKYAVTSGDEESAVGEPRNYIGWLVTSNLQALKEQKLVGEDGSQLPVPAALLYRLLHRALLLANHDAAMKLYEELQLVGQAVRREQDFVNVEAARTVTRWEFMEARINRVMPQISGADMAVGDFLTTDDGLARPAAELLREVRDSVGKLEPLKTAELERLFAEHLDLCAYRLDAWQTALFSRRLERLNLLRGSVDGDARKRGVHLGAYGWLENVRPAPPAAVVPVEQIPVDLREDGIAVVEQPNNGGYIHGPSINHAVAAAVLRNAYLTHADQQNAEFFSVKLTSERVRTAISFLEGVRNGQELGALLGYQFERALHDRYVIDGKALAQFILAFRKQYPLVADKVTPDAGNESIDRKEAYQVVDGYALLEAVFLSDTPLAYPFGVEGLPLDPNDGARQAIIAEVERLRDTLDAIADLSLAEGVFQVTQGNYDRAGAMLKALSEGHAPPEPEIIRTPRGGAVVNHRIALQFEAEDVASPWSGDATPRSIAVPGLNKWLGDLIGPPQSIQFSVSYELDDTPLALSVADLRLQPIDVIHLVRDEAGRMEGTRQINDLTEIEMRIDHAYRLARKAADPGFDPSGRTTISFMSREEFTEAGARTWFEILPLLRALRNIVTTCRPLGADDYVLASEENTDPAAGGNVKRWDLQAMEHRLEVTAGLLAEAVATLRSMMSSVPPEALNEKPEETPDLSGVDYDGLRAALIRLSSFGLPDAFPRHALLPELPAGASDAEKLSLLRARQALIEQGFLTLDLGTARHADAESLFTFDDLTEEVRNRLTVEEKAGIYQSAAALLLGDAFRLVPSFTFKNRPEIEAARAFANDAAPVEGLLRFTQERLAAAAPGSVIQDWRSLAVDEWLQGAGAVRKQVALVDQLQTCQDAFDRVGLSLQPVQLPFDAKAHWVALEFPEVDPESLDDPAVFVPRGDFLSIVRHLPEGHRDSDPQAGLLIDEWNEVIPNRIETTGIAVHYNQPNTEPPQCLLLAVSPTIKGQWDWNDLVDTLVDTFDRAKRRGVEPDFLRTTPFAQLLPAVLTTFTSFPFGTISTNLAAQPASMVFEERQ